ncbi:unnamed protein product [Adineta steineri]|uniref:Hint domain-containing protein n=2 Tax=Adineta steineri TaxID=433720 RepID=A0A814RM48_9BILA|nr:unnamed protein product [Adineta steineri]
MNGIEEIHLPPRNQHKTIPVPANHLVSVKHNRWSKRFKIWIGVCTVIGIATFLTAVLIPILLINGKSAISTTSITTKASTTSTTSTTSITTTTATTSTKTTSTSTTISTTTSTTTPAATTTTTGCYYGGDLVNLVEGGQRHIKNLKVGDKIWSINDHNFELVEDEIVLMMHNEPSQKAMFYTFQSVEGGQFSLTGSHTLPVFDTIRNEITMKRADSVTMQDRLIMFGKTVEITNISITVSQGFYAPLTLTGYLMVNNVSTSVFSANYKASSATLQLGFLPIRIYYHITRFIYGNKYNPFVEIQEGLHPIPHFYKQQQVKLRFFVLKLPKPFFSTIIIVIIVHFIQKWTSKLLLKHK